MVDTHHEHGGVVTGGGGHDDLLGTTHKVLGCTGLREEFAGGLHDVVGTRVTPHDLGRIQLVGDSDDVTVNNEFAAFNHDGARVAAVDGVVVEHVLHVVHGDEGIIDVGDLDLLFLAGSTHHETANAAKAVDSNLDRPVTKWHMK